jgi:hypothetical protein
MSTLRTDDRHDRTWRTAGDRVFLYLRALDVPALEAFELARKALDEAGRNLGNDASMDNPVAAMTALWEALRRYREVAGNEGLISSMPPLRRLHMRSQKLSSYGLRHFFGSRKKTGAKP